MEEAAMSRRTKDGPQRPPKPLPEEFARNAIAHDEADPTPGDLVRILEAAARDNA
jgi:hypothetical protein